MGGLCSSQTRASDYNGNEDSPAGGQLGKLAGEPPRQGVCKVHSGGIRDGFMIGYNRHQEVLRAHSGNMATDQHHQRVRLSKEGSGAGCPWLTELNRGPYQPDRPEPKGRETSKVALNCRPVSAQRESMNDGINRGLASLTYPRVDHLAMLIHQVGRETYLVKADVKEAYRNIPIHQDDRWLLGVEWGGVTHVNGAIPFGLRSVPKIFSAVADAAQWILIQRGLARVLHYLDDFMIVEKDFSTALEAQRTGKGCKLC